MTRAWPIVLAICAACSRDIQLGSESPDAPIGPFIAGSYMTSYLAPAQPHCSGSLAGHEADFATITPASASLVDGIVELAGDTAHVDLSGTPIESGLHQASVTLVPDPNAGLPAIWDGVVTGDFASGPDSTQISANGLAIDSSTATAPSGMQGVYVRDYVTASGDGDCSVELGALLVRQ